MGIETPLRKLEIIGNDTTSILKANHSNLISKGSREYILSVREQMLSNRSFKVPEDWDVDWNIRLGPIWTPAELGSTNLVCWLGPEYYHPLDTDADIIAQASDRSGNGVIWENTWTSASCPTFTSPLVGLGSSSDGFKGMGFDGTQWIYSTDESGDGELDPGTGDFSITMLVEFGGISTAEKYVLCSDGTKDFALSVKENLVTGVDQYKVYFDGSATTAAVSVNVSAPVILTVGRSGGDQFLKLANLSINDTNITGTESVDIDNSQQFFIGGKEALSDRSAGNMFTGNIYEIMFYNGTLSTDDIKNLEGYLAHKYAQTSFLYSAHPYKTNPPRTEVPA